MKLKTITVEFQFVVVVNDGQDPEFVARDNIKECVRDMSEYDFDVSVNDYKDVTPEGWDDDCIPYGGDGNTVIGQL
jgi:hypothetical protein